MIRTEFFDHWDRLVRWCGKDPAKLKDASDAFFDRIRSIPSEAWPWIVDSYIDAHEPYCKMPTPSWVKEAYQSWLERHPYKQKPKEPERWCPQCHGKGYLDLIRDMDPTPMESLCRCGHCDNWKRTMGISIPKWTRLEAHEEGWVIKTQPAEAGDERTMDVRKLLLFPRHDRSREPVPISEPIQRLVKTEEAEADDVPF